MNYRESRQRSGGYGTVLILAAIVGYFFFKGGTARLTALAARLPVTSFVMSEETEYVSAENREEFSMNAGYEVLERASGVHGISLFIKEQNGILAWSQPDPAYAGLWEETGKDKEGQSVDASAEEATGDHMENAGQSIALAEESGNNETENNQEAVDTGQPAMAAEEIKGTLYTLEELSDFEFLKSKFFYVHKSTTVYPEQLDAAVLLGKDMTLPESTEPQILLFHTHGSEAFSDSAEGDPNMTVVGVGNYLAQLLSQEYGIQVIHNTEVFPYSDSYSMALDMLNQTLAENPSIQVTIDLHRDSGGHDVVDINGKPTAPIMFFNGMCQTPEGPLEGVENPYLMDNLAFNFQMKLKAEAYYPGFTLRTFLKAYRYNQHVLPRATLIEVGTENNTFEEAKNAMEPLADILYKVLRGK